MSNEISRRIRLAALLKGGVAVAAMSVALGATAVAQEAEDDEARQQTIVVTGSRIARDPNVVAPVPVQSVNADDIALSGEFDLADVVNDIPALLSSTTPEQSSNFGTQGAATLNLRGMGSERTLVLVDGRRHVSGIEGSAAVDITSIPSALVERVEVLTGGASAIYGADAVTGVVNFIMKDEFEGLQLDLDIGIAGEGDGEQISFGGIWGTDYAGGNGNLVLSAYYSEDSGLKAGDRDFYRDNGIFGTRANPALRFQRGDINPSTMPNLARFYDFNNTGLYPYGLRIPSESSFISSYTREFGVAPNLTAAERALLERVIGAPSRALLRSPVFSISSTGGIIAPGDFGLGNGVDLDGNGTPDCLDSFTGYNSSLDGAASFGIVGGCWNIEANGNVRPVRDGLISGNFDGFGGDGIGVIFNEEALVPDDKRIALNFQTGYNFTDTARWFLEAKYTRADVNNLGPYNTFWDLLYGAPDNPFLPAALQPLAQATGGLYITRDMVDIGPAGSEDTRTTYRVVAGIEGEGPFGSFYEVAVNYGAFELNSTAPATLIMDRFFAAIDVVTDPTTGQPVCRSDLDPSLYPTTIFGIPSWDPGYYTFSPGDGQCRPANIWGGVGNIGQDALDFFMTSTETKEQIDQFVFSAFLTGDTEAFFSLPAGPIGFATGVEYRDESSEIIYDPLDIGIIPAGGLFPAGELIENVSGNESLVYDPSAALLNSKGSFDVWDAFIEVSVPLLKDVILAEELTIDGAYRYSDYSSIGETGTWKVGLSWAPIEDIRFRATQSQAVRAPNIFELFSPDQGATFRPVDPCDQGEIDALRAADPSTASIREANCRAGGAGLPGLPAGWTDPLSARFFGVSGGNPNLQEETADTITVGFVLQPRFLDGFTLTVDYWDVTIEDAISAVAAQDIVDNCYDSNNFPNQFCQNFTRNTDPGSAQFGGFTFLRQSQLNFGAIEASGVDFAATYRFGWGENDFQFGVAGTKQEKLDFFFDPGDPTAVDPELGEIRRPEWAGNITAAWERGPFTVSWQTQYIGEQIVTGEIETYETIFGTQVEADAMFIHDLAARWERDNQTFTLGVNNITEEEPYVIQRAFPVSPRGRYFFFGAQARF